MRVAQPATTSALSETVATETIQAPPRPGTPALGEGDVFENPLRNPLLSSAEALLLSEFDQETLAAFEKEVALARAQGVQDDSDSDEDGGVFLLPGTTEETLADDGVTVGMIKAATERDAHGNYTYAATQMSLRIELLTAKAGVPAKLGVLTKCFPHLQQCIEEIRSEGHSVTVTDAGDGTATVTILKKA